MDTPQGGRARGLRPRMRLPGPDAAGLALNWIGGERIAIGGVPPARLVARLAEQGVTHIVNCRSRPQVRWSGDLAAERAAFGPGRVAHAPMLAYAVLQLGGHAPGQAAELVPSYRTEAELVPAYVRSVERWLATAVR